MRYSSCATSPAERYPATRLTGMPPRTVPVPTGVLWRVLRDALAAAAGGRELAVLDVGGGTGGLAVPLAQLGHRVTVVDPSPDSLAALRRRTEEAGVAARVTGRQGDLATLDALVAPGGVDVVLCHSVLEVIDDPAAALQALGGVVRAGGLVSVLAAARPAAIVARAQAGRLTEALHILRDAGGRDTDAPGAPRRFDVTTLVELVAGAGLTVVAVHGIGLFTGLVPGAVLDRDSAARDLLAELESEAGSCAELLGLASRLHVLASRAPTGDR